MIWLKKLIYAGVLAVALAAAITAGAWEIGSVWRSDVHSAYRDSSEAVADPDYVQGLVERGIVTLPHHDRPRPVLINH
jgi:hypothetical protein